MEMIRTALLPLVWTFLVLVSSEAGGTVPLYVGHLSGTPSTLIVGSDQIYTSVGSIGIAFNLTLSGSSRHKYIYSDSNIAAIAEVPGQDGTFIMCFHDGSCSAVCGFSPKCDHHQGYSAIPLEDVSFPKNSTLLSGSDLGVYVGATRVYHNGSKWIELVSVHIQYNNHMMKSSSSTVERFQIQAREFASRDFLYTFRSGNYGYFIAMDNFVNHSLNAIKVLRVGQNSDPSRLTPDITFEVEVRCNTKNNHFTIVSHLKINQTVILGLNGEGSSTLCMFDIADIDQTISSTLDKCMTGNYEFSFPWSHELLSCSDITKVS